MFPWCREQLNMFYCPMPMVELFLVQREKYSSRLTAQALNDCPISDTMLQYKNNTFFFVKCSNNKSILFAQKEKNVLTKFNSHTVYLSHDTFPRL